MKLMKKFAALIILDFLVLSSLGSLRSVIAFGQVPPAIPPPAATRSVNKLTVRATPNVHELTDADAEGVTSTPSAS
jgi:hypothetical protein